MLPSYYSTILNLSSAGSSSMNYESLCVSYGGAGWCLCDNNINNNLLEYCIVMQWSVMSTRQCLYLVSNIGGLLLSSLSSLSF